MKKRIKEILIITIRKIIVLFLKLELLFECLLDRNKRKIVKYVLTSKRLPIFPYPFLNKYEPESIEVFHDKDNYPYVIYNGKKLFMKKSWKAEQIRKYYISILKEQDENSPHKYFLNESRYPDNIYTVADIGTAEGIFSLDIIEKVKKIYFFECDPEWIPALQRTFAEWKDKIEIVEKFVGDKNSNSSITLDQFFKNRDIDYIKADIEGAEEKMLEGGRNIFANKVKKALLCVYHSPHAEKHIKSFLNKYGFKFECNPGYMLYIYDIKHFCPPFIRHGVMYTYKN